MASTRREETAALDERDLVKKGVDMALRALGKRNEALRKAAVDLARRLASSSEGSRAWIGRSALRQLAGRRGGARRDRRGVPAGRTDQGTVR